MENSTGLPGLDKILHGIRNGDNIVWQTDFIDYYIPFIKSFCNFAKVNGKKLVYFRFAKHQELVSEKFGATIIKINPEEGFENFISKIHKVINETGTNGYYVFDSLSELAIDCYSERMIGNFFILTCPLLSKFESVAYFTVIRNYHSYHAAQPISNTTQILIDIYYFDGDIYIQPIKVLQRFSSTMYMLHKWKDDEFLPIMESSIISKILTSSKWHGLQSASYRMIGLWDRRFLQAEEIFESYKKGKCSKEIADNVFEKQLKQLVSRDERMLALIRQYFDYEDIIYLWKRTIGSGMIGGKSVGMLLARAILKKEFSQYKEIIEDHDSFFIGSDTFYSFLVHNECWHILQKQKSKNTLYEDIDIARERILNGVFPDFILKRFSDMLDYFGQSPIIVRSSSLLEDSFGNAFSGKYESVFCVNNGSLKERLDEFLKAVKIIYASTMSKEALAYRAKRGVLDRDEQMPLLVQRVSGKRYRKIFLPHLAGVGVSFNPYSWDVSIDPRAGLIRLVFGLGTRAVERHDDDYTRVIALNFPQKRPEGNTDEIIHFTQKRVDFLNLDKNLFDSNYFNELIKENIDLPVELFSSLIENGNKKYRLINFDKIILQTSFIQDIHKILAILKEAYGHNIEIEFTVNFLSDFEYKINLLQCRPYLAREMAEEVVVVPQLDEKNLILAANGGIIGENKNIEVDLLIYVIPNVYGKLSESERYTVARTIGKIMHHKYIQNKQKIMLIGPGRWGTHIPALGVPVSFSEINKASVICEIDVMHKGLSPDLSLGTHFFNDLVEMNILYIGFFAAKKENIFNDDFLLKLPNRLNDLIPDSDSLANVIKVIDSEDLSRKSKFWLTSDSLMQKCLLYMA